MSQLADADVAGVSHDLGREANLKIYEKFVRKLMQDAGDRAFVEWLKSKV